MKHSNYILISLIGVLFVFNACKSNTSDPAPIPAAKTIADTTTQNVAATSGIPKGVVLHWMCPNNCKGSGGTGPGKCPVCGSAYEEPLMYIDPVTHAATPTHTEPQNAKGVYHFICPKGDPGGAGIAGNCPKCGTPLEHNQAYHEN